MADGDTFFGRPASRVDGRLKVTGAAKYAGEYGAPDLLHGYVVSGSIAKGRIKSIDTSKALALPGVVEVFTHENRPGTAWRDSKYQDEVGPPGHPFRPLRDEHILFAGQPIALVVAQSFEAARDAAGLVKAEYIVDEHITDLDAVKGQSYEPPKKRSGISPPPKPRGHAEKAYADAPVKLKQEYRVAVEHHNPMEPFASTVIWEGDGKITVYDKTQGSQNVQAYLAGVFGFKADNVRVINSFVGGGFGSGLRPQHQVFLAVLAAEALKRSVRVVLTRDQMFTFVYRPETIQSISLGAGRDGKLQSIQHHAVAGTSQFEDHQEVVVNWSSILYECDNTKLTHELSKIDTYTPGDMRAPGATLGVYAIESAMDELAYATNIDPIEIRLRNYTERDEDQNKEFTSKALRTCFQEGADRFGWSKRNPVPRSMREGRELIGWGMASGVWEAKMSKNAAKATLKADGTLEVATATSDIGTGTYTVMTQTGADAMGLPMGKVTAKLGDSTLPKAPVEGGSWAAASACSAIQAACKKLRTEMLKHAKQVPNSPLVHAKADDVQALDERLVLVDDPVTGVSFADILQQAGEDSLEAEAAVSPDMLAMMKYVGYTHAAIFVEVRVDEQLGVVRVTRVVDAIAAGKIINPKTARSQILGGVVMAIGAALHEETFPDHNLGRFMNHNLAEYHVPANADIENIEVIFVEEHDDKVSPIGVKGLGEIGIVGTTAAIANAVFHATGVRVRDLPITVDKIFGQTPDA